MDVSTEREMCGRQKGRGGSKQKKAGTERQSQQRRKQ